MCYYPAGKLDSLWTGPYLIVATLGWTVGIQRHPDEPVIFIHCQDVKKIPPPSGVQSWLTIPPPGGTPAVPMLGASTVAHTSRDSPSVAALPPVEGAELADVDSVRNGGLCCGTAKVSIQVCRRRVAGGHHKRTQSFRKRFHSPQRPFGWMILVCYTSFFLTNRMRDPFD